MNPIRIGLIGCGGIANSTHLPQLQRAGGATVQALCDIDAGRLYQTGERCQVPVHRRFADYRDLIACADVDAVDICTPNDSHVPIALAAVGAGKPYCIEKPVGLSFEEASSLAEATRQAGLPAMVCFSYRFMPAVRLARTIMREGRIGRPIHVYANYLKASALITGRRLDWRFDEAIARYGVSGDLAVHLIDLIRYLVDDFTGVFSQTGVIVRERLRLDRDEWARVGTDDYCHFLAELEQGVPAVFSISRCAVGNKNHIAVAIYGDKGSLKFDLNNQHDLQLCLDDGSGGDSGFTTLTAPDDQPGQMQTFVNLVRGDAAPDLPDLATGVRCQAVLDAILESAGSRRWVSL